MILYNRAVYDLASIIELVVDQVEASARYRIIDSLNSVKRYLEEEDVTVTAAQSYDDPLTTVNNLIYSIEDRQAVKSLKRSSKSIVNRVNRKVPPITLFSSSVRKRGRASHKPPVSQLTSFMRVPPSDSDDSDEEDGDNGEEEEEEADEQSSTNDYGEEDDASEVPEHINEVVIQYETDWQPAVKKKKSVTKEIPIEPEMYLPDGIEYVNPAPPPVSGRWNKKTAKDENTKWVCAYCRLITTGLKYYKIHLQTNHKEEDICSCLYCKREFVNAALCKLHWCSKRHRCKVCGAVFIRLERLKKHMATHCVSAMCKVCQTSFANANSCAAHIYNKHETIIMCDSCLVQIDPSESAATSPARIFCKNCLETATGEEPEALPGTINNDILIKITNAKALIDGSNAQNQRRYRGMALHCDICDKVMLSNYLMKRHLESTSHAAAARLKLGSECPEFPCNECGKIFITEDLLVKHSRIHAPDYCKQLYKCKICHSELGTRSGYRRHVRSHINARNYACRECSSAFNNSYQLKAHADVCHNPDKWFPCTLCEKRFKSGKRRLQHIDMVHHNYIYVCPHCVGYTTRFGTLLKNHFASRHPCAPWTKPMDYRQVSDEPYSPRPKSQIRSIMAPVTHRNVLIIPPEFKSLLEPVVWAQVKSKTMVQNAITGQNKSKVIYPAEGERPVGGTQAVSILKRKSPADAITLPEKATRRKIGLADSITLPEGF